MFSFWVISKLFLIQIHLHNVIFILLSQSAEACKAGTNGVTNADVPDSMNRPSMVGNFKTNFSKFKIFSSIFFHRFIRRIPTPYSPAKMPWSYSAPTPCHHSSRRFPTTTCQHRPGICCWMNKYDWLDFFSPHLRTMLTLSFSPINTDCVDLAGCLVVSFVQEDICKRIITLYRLAIMYVPMSLSTWESVLSTLIRITKALMPSEPPKDRLSTLCGRLAMPLFQVGLRSVNHVVLRFSTHLIDRLIVWSIDWLIVLVHICRRCSTLGWKGHSARTYRINCGMSWAKFCPRWLHGTN